MTVEVLINSVRDKDFQRDLLYVLHALAGEHSPELGIEGLPDRAREAAWNVAFLCENLGIMVVMGLVDRRIILSIGNYRVMRSWQVLEPYIRAERERRGARFMDFFENLYVEMRENPPEKIYRSLGLRRTE
jgi:hypothetical protein